MARGISNIVRSRKEEYGLTFFVDYSSPLDILPIEAWNATQTAVKARPYWDDLELKIRAVEGDDALSRATKIR